MQNVFRKCTPSLASRSMFGVFTCGCPAQPSASQRMIVAEDEEDVRAPGRLFRGRPAAGADGDRGADEYRRQKGSSHRGDCLMVTRRQRRGRRQRDHNGGTKQRRGQDRWLLARWPEAGVSGSDCRTEEERPHNRPGVLHRPGNQARHRAARVAHPMLGNSVAPFLRCDPVISVPSDSRYNSQE